VALAVISVRRSLRIQSCTICTQDSVDVMSRRRLTRHGILRARPEIFVDWRGASTSRRSRGWYLGPNLVGQGITSGMAEIVPRSSHTGGPPRGHDFAVAVGRTDAVSELVSLAHKICRPNVTRGSLKNLGGSKNAGNPRIRKGRCWMVEEPWRQDIRSEDWYVPCTPSLAFRVGRFLFTAPAPNAAVLAEMCLSRKYAKRSSRKQYIIRQRWPAGLGSGRRWT
jgi:hypothetical protein